MPVLFLKYKVSGLLMTDSVVKNEVIANNALSKKEFHSFRRMLPAPLSDVAWSLWFDKPNFMQDSMKDYMVSTTSYNALSSGRAEEMSAQLMQTVFNGILTAEIAYELSLVVKVATREDSHETNNFILDKAGLL